MNRAYRERTVAASTSSKTSALATTATASGPARSPRSSARPRQCEPVHQPKNRG
ncbi:MAG: hypothetical protein IRY90_00815 [Actinomadura rubrobrunea]|nr:hypothetical protein [Actinomadura rubrobrunea]